MMAFFNLTEADYPEADIAVCSDNWPAVMFFAALGQGSWNMGSSGPTGLRFETFREVRLARGVRMAEWPDLFTQIRVMEQAALEEIYKDE